ncbi:GNAT family N-acetyltransferase, partial [Nostoc sp. NIES-2111]
GRGRDRGRPGVPAALPVRDACGGACRPGALTVERVSDDASARALGPEWREVFGRLPGATPFQSPDWLLPWWDSFRPGLLALLAVRLEGRLAGVAPFYGESGTDGVRLLPLGISLSDYWDILVEPEASAPVLAALASSIPRLCPEAGRVDLGDLPPSAHALEIPAPHGWRREENAHEACPVLDLRDGFSSVPSLRRRKLRMARHRAERAGGMSLSEPAPDDALAFIDRLVALHGSRWETKGDGGVLADPRVVAFHRAALPRLLERGLADCRLLHIGGQLAGAYFGLRRGAEAFAYLSGFDPAFHREAPGTLLVGDAIERACERGARRFHFLRGREAYKYDWGAEDVFTRRLSLVRDTGHG